MLLPRTLGYENAAQASPEVVLPLVATLSIAVRLWLRRRYKIALKWDDWLIVVAVVFSWVMFGIWTYMCAELIGSRAEASAPSTPSRMQKLCLALDFFYGTGVNLVKFSFLFLYLRSFGTTPKVRNWIYGLFGIISLYTVSRIVEVGVLCIPICLQKSASFVPIYYFVMRALNWATEILILCFPVPILWKMKITTQQKIGISGVFFLGFLTCLISAYRLAGLVHSYTFEHTYYISTTSQFNLLAMLELNVGILTACIPAIRTPAMTFISSACDRIFKRKSEDSSISAVQTEYVGCDLGVMSPSSEKRVLVTADEKVRPSVHETELS